MALRILLADGSPGAGDLARELRARGLEVDLAAPGEAPSRLEPGGHAVALVRGGGPEVAALRAVDPILPVVALVDAEGDRARSPAEAADAVVAGAAGAPALAALCALSASLRERSARVRKLEERLARVATPAGRELEFLKRMLFVEVKRSRRYGHPVALALVAIDRWDGLGPALAPKERAGLLGEVLGIVSRSLRDIDLAVPFSDERFVVLMPDTKAEGALRVARRICARVRERTAAPILTASAGVAAHAGDRTVSFSGLVKRAKDALARARAAGGDRAELAAPPKKRERISIG